jgi:hypothetical protein
LWVLVCGTAAPYARYVKFRLATPTHRAGRDRGGGKLGRLLPQRNPEDRSPSIENIPLQITNHHYLDITIYAIHDGQRTRIGVAGGSAHTSMVLPSRLLGVGRELQLYGDPIGSSERAITEVVVVQPGQFIEWLLESGLSRSTVGVY